MTEKLSKSNPVSRAIELSTVEVLGEVAGINDLRRGVLRMIDEVDPRDINAAFTVVLDELGSEGAVTSRIDMLYSCTTLIDRQLLMLEGIENRIEAIKEKPLAIRESSKHVLEEIHDLRADLTRQIQNLQMQKNTAANREKIHGLEHEKIYSSAARYAEAMDARAHADADLQRLNEPLAIVLAERDVRFEILAEYQSEARELNARVTKVSAAMGMFVSSLTVIKDMAKDPYAGADIRLPERLPDIDVNTLARQVSHDDGLPFGSDSDSLHDVQAPDNPANTNEFSDDVVSIDAAYIHMVPEEAKQPDSLHPLISEAVLQARQAYPTPKKGKRVRGFLRIN